MFRLCPRTQVAAAPKRAPALSAGVTTVPVAGFSDGNPPPPPPDFSSVAYAPDPGPGPFPALMPTEPPSPDPLKLRVRAESLRHALPMPAAEILQFHTN